MNDEPMLIDLLAETDVCPAQAPLPEQAWSRDAALAEIERRVGMHTQDRIEQRLRHAVLAQPRRRAGGSRRAADHRRHQHDDTLADDR